MLALSYKCAKLRRPNLHREYCSCTSTGPKSLCYALQVEAQCLAEARLYQDVYVRGQATSTEVWMYRNRETREAVIAFRGTSNVQDMMTDSSLALSAFSPGNR